MITKTERYEKLKHHLQTMGSFTEEHIPDIPKMENTEDYKEYVIKNFIRCGAIPKSKLVIGKVYKGSCRNANRAIWNGEQFIYKREKFGYKYDEKINHFEDDNGYDLFVPIKEV